MNQAKLLMKHAFLLDVLCLALCCVLLFLGINDKVASWVLATGALIALVALCASIWLFVKARKIDRAENRRIEREILESASREDAVDKAIEDGDITDDEGDDYKADDEQ